MPISKDKKQIYKFAGNIAMSQKWHTLLSGLLAVLSVNVVIAVYIVMAMREPRSKAEPEPDPVFASRARSSLQAHQKNTSSGVDKKNA